MLADRVDQALGRRARAGGELSVLVLDLDGFKAVNDSLGHAMGDRLLVEVGERLATSVRGLDIAARLGGDEFAVVLEGAGEAGATLAAGRLLEELARPVMLDGTEVQLTASIGIAVATDAADTQDVLLRNADLAMYLAKAAGKGRYEVYRAGMHAEVVARAELERELREAI